MSVTGLLQVNVVGEFHVLRMDTEDLKTASWVGDTNVDLAVETTEPTESRVDRVRAVSRSHHDDIRARLETVHKGEQLRDDAALDLAIRLLTLRRNGVDLVDENDGRGVLLCLLERLPQVAFRLSRHLTHNLRAVDKEEKRPGFVRDCSCHKRLTGTRGTVHEDTPRGFDTDRLEELRMAEWELD